MSWRINNNILEISSPFLLIFFFLRENQTITRKNQRSGWEMCPHLLTLKSHWCALSISSVFQPEDYTFRASVLLRLIGAHFLGDPEEQKSQRLSRDLSQRAAQETDGSGGGSRDGTQWLARRYYSKPGHTHLLSPSSQEINKLIVAAAHMGSHRMVAALTG